MRLDASHNELRVLPAGLHRIGALTRLQLQATRCTRRRPTSWARAEGAVLAFCRDMAPEVLFFVQEKDLVYFGFFGAEASRGILFVQKYIARVCAEKARINKNCKFATIRFSFSFSFSWLFRCGTRRH